jgi:hypothetical protein
MLLMVLYVSPLLGGSAGRSAMQWQHIQEHGQHESLPAGRRCAERGVPRGRMCCHACLTGRTKCLVQALCACNCRRCVCTLQWSKACRAAATFVIGTIVHLEPSHVWQGRPKLSVTAAPTSVLTGGRLRAQAGGRGGGGGGGRAAVRGGHGGVRGGLRPEQQRGRRRPAGAALQLGRRAALARHARAGAPRQRAALRPAARAGPPATLSASGACVVSGSCARGSTPSATTSISWR